jgi:hypothetical protein
VGIFLKEDVTMKRTHHPDHRWQRVMKALALAVGVLSLLADPAVATADPLSSWDKQLAAPGRFLVLPAFHNEAVLDKETGLVWEQSPDTTRRNWDLARVRCIDKDVGGRKGWRLPSIPELASLVDPSQSNPALPARHPFTNVQSANYWSATTLADGPSVAWAVGFGNGGVAFDFKTDSFHVWCVRGGMNADQY